MDVSFTNVLEGARQYFQGVPAPSANGLIEVGTEDAATPAPPTATSVPVSSREGTGNTATSASGGTSSSVTTTTITTTTTSSNATATIHDVDPSSGSSASASISRLSDESIDYNRPVASPYWPQPGEPYAPQPTRVEVPDTRPGSTADNEVDASPNSPASGRIVLTEMQPKCSSKPVPPQTEPADRTTPNEASKQTSQPDRSSPAPVYQQLNPFSTRVSSGYNTDASNSSSRPASVLSYHASDSRQSPVSVPVVPQRAQYYPRYHHPDITKSAPVPFSHSTVYQSSSTIDSQSARSTPVDQQQQPDRPAASVIERQTPASSSNASQPGNPIIQYSSTSTASNGHVYQHHSVIGTSHQQPQQRPNDTSSHDASTPSSVPPVASSSATSGYSSHIPTMPPPKSQQQPPQVNRPSGNQQHGIASPMNPAIGYPARSNLPQGSSGVSTPVHSQPLLPQLPSSMGYHPIPSPQETTRHATPSPHRQSPHLSNLHGHPHAGSPALGNNFQPRSPTYPPPPPIPSPQTQLPSRSTPHSYVPPTSSQHYQNSSGGYPYGPQLTYHHSYQKANQLAPQVPVNYYARPAMQPYLTSQPSQQTLPSSSSAAYPTTKSVVTYNGDVKKSQSMDPSSYNAYRPPTGSTHNLPPIAALSSYHSTRRESGAKTQSLPRRTPTSKLSSYQSPVGAAVPQRSVEYAVPRVQPATGISTSSSTTSGRSRTPVTSSSYPNTYGQSGQQQHAYQPYATSSHVCVTTSGTTVTSIGPSYRSSVPVTTIHGYQQSPVENRMSSYHTPHQQDPRPSENYPSKDYVYQNSTPSTISQPTPPPVSTIGAATTPQTNGVPIRKRESPLDLSVKTVKTSADSTAQDDLEAGHVEKHVSSSNPIARGVATSRSMPPPQGHPGAPATPYYDHHRPSSNGTRSSASSVRPPTPQQVVCAPKVDFLPDFNSAPLRHHPQPGLHPSLSGNNSHEGSLRRSSSQQLYVSPAQPGSQQQIHPHHHQQHANSAPPQLLPVSSFKKTSLPTGASYDGPMTSGPSSYLHHPHPHHPASDGVSARSRYHHSSMIEQQHQQQPARIATGPTLPSQDYPSDPTKYYYERMSKHTAPPPPPGVIAQKERASLKRPNDSIHDPSVVSKQPKLDTWRMAIDKQIQQKLSTAKALHEQHKRQEMTLPVPLPNGTLVPANVAYEQQQRTDVGYSPSDALRYQQQAYCDKRTYQDVKVTHGTPSYVHPVIAKPSGVHPLPQQIAVGQPTYSNYRHTQPSPSSQHQHQQLQRGLPYPPGAANPPSQTIDQPSNTGADKRVLSLLRNSLESKQQREEQQLNSQQPIIVNHNQQSFQNKVVAPVEPKTNIGRHNLSPFTAASLLERNSNTPPHYKFHVPRAVDSITQEAPKSPYASRVNSSATLPGKEALLGPRTSDNQIHRDKDDGLAAILAAKIRTKAELKQVGTGQFTGKPIGLPSQEPSATPKELEIAASTSTPHSGSSAGSPPKLTREKTPILPPRRRLFSRTEEDNIPIAAAVPTASAPLAIPSSVPSRSSGLRSSSETSVFDFRESDSDSEMPVLERQTLEEMRRDRKQLSKVQPPVSLNDAMCMSMASNDLVKIELKENDKINEVDPCWTATCDKFMEQLRTGEGSKKRGRKKKSECSTTTVSSKNEDSPGESYVKDNSPKNISPPEIKAEDIKKELIEPEVPVEDTVKDASPDETLSNIESARVVQMEVKVKVEPDTKTENYERAGSDADELPLIKRTRRKRARFYLESDDDEESFDGDTVMRRARNRRRGRKTKLDTTSDSDLASEEAGEEAGEDEDESEADSEFGNSSSVAVRLRARKRSGNNSSEGAEGMKLRSRVTTPVKVKNNEKDNSKTNTNAKSQTTAQKAKPKPLFGDGSDFRPGWEDEVYDFKKSLRMPTSLITVSKPSRFHRLSTSLPDLDPGSPSLSVSMDSSDVCLDRKRNADSDNESNYSFSVASGIGTSSKIDDEEATSSTTISCPPKSSRSSKAESNSIVDLLAQKVGTGKRDQKKKLKDKLEKGSKLTHKSNNEPELLPTPSLTPLLSTNEQATKGKSPVKNNKNSSKPIKVSDSFLLGYFRKETVNNFRDTFKSNHALPNEFSTFVLKSRTRTETRTLKKQATIREVFGEDRPASAPPMQNHEDTSQDEDEDSPNENADAVNSEPRTLKQRVVSRLKNVGLIRSQKAVMNSKRRLLIAKRRKDLLKSLAEKKLQRIKAEGEDEAQDEAQDDDEDNNDNEVPSRKKLKIRTGRRKFRSGFDYIRKKKKPIKKDETLSKERKRPTVIQKSNPERVADVQSEIRTWVIKKGVGETILHRAARNGCTDVTAYCLEKLNNPPGPKDNAGYTPLHEACSRGHLEIAKLLLAYGANVSESANGGIRPLHEAAENGATEIVRLLLSYGADPLLATYSGQTPLMLAADTDAYSIIEQHLDDIQGRVNTPWPFGGPSTIFDPEETGYNPLGDPPSDSPEPELDEIEMEVSDVNLPVLFSLSNDPDKWVLLQDLMAALRIKSRDALLRQVNPKAATGPPAIAHRDVMKELKLADFLEQSRCCHLLSGGERINVRGSKVTLIKYNDKVKSLLNVERVVISLR